jgi:hypothetical protein
VPDDELSSIPGLEEKHVRALARRQVTDLRGLARADQRVLYNAMANIRPRPTIGQISRWQDAAKSRLEEAAIDVSEWHTAASFAVVFAQRQVGDAWERRVEAERTEVEPERNPEVWPGWECEPLCGWMLGQLGRTDAAGVSAQPAPGEPGAPRPAPAEPEAVPPSAAQPPARRAPARTQLRIDSAAIIDAARRVDVVSAGALLADVPAELVAPVRVVMTVSGAQSGTEVRVVTRILRRDGPGWNPQAPVVLGRSGLAEFDLSQVAVGRHKLALIAWAPDATARPVSVELPALTIRSGSG